MFVQSTTDKLHRNLSTAPLAKASRVRSLVLVLPLMRGTSRGARLLLHTLLSANGGEVAVALCLPRVVQHLISLSLVILLSVSTSTLWNNSLTCHSKIELTEHQYSIWSN